MLEARATDRSSVGEAMWTDQSRSHGDDEGMDESRLQKGVDDACTAFYHEGIDTEVAEFKEDLGDGKHCGE